MLSHLEKWRGTRGRPGCGVWGGRGAWEILGNNSFCLLLAMWRCEAAEIAINSVFTWSTHLFSFLRPVLSFFSSWQSGHALSIALTLPCSQPSSHHNSVVDSFYLSSSPHPHPAWLPKCLTLAYSKQNVSQKTVDTAIDALQARREREAENTIHSHWPELE